MPATTTRPTVVGLDLSTTGTGVCALVGESHRAITIGRSLKKAPWTEEEMVLMVDAIGEFLRMFKPKVVALEGYSHGSYNVAMLAELGGCVRLMLHSAGIPFVVFSPSTLKKFVCGTGKTEKGKGKALMLLNVFKRYGVSFTDDNQADAYSLARMARAIVSPSEWATFTGIQRACYTNFHASVLCCRHYAPGLTRVASK